MESMAVSHLFGGLYKDRRVLVTGHTGFKGSWLAFWLRAMGAQVTGLALDPDSNPSHWTLLRLDDLPGNRIDLRDAEGVRALLDSHRPELIFHLAAQPLVRRSYREPTATFNTNVMGLVNLFEAIRNCPSVRAIVNATTDKVYEGRPGTDGYRETDLLGGHDPYSTSKACGELVSTCFRKSFFNRDDGRGFRVRLATARAGNVIGGGDWAEDRLVPDLVRAGSANKPMKFRNPTAIRPWQHVLEPLSGYLLLGQALLEKEMAEGAWNFGPHTEGEITVGELISRLRTCWPALHVEHDAERHPHEVAVLRLNCNKAIQELGWRPVWPIETAITRCAAWYRTFYETGQIKTADDVERYIADAQRGGLGWAK